MGLEFLVSNAATGTSALTRGPFKAKGKIFFTVPFLCFSKEKNQKKGALFQGVFWVLPKNQNRFAKFSTGIQKFFTQSNSYTIEKRGDDWIFYLTFKNRDARCVKKENLFYLQY